jgi:hypothetical protein
VVATAERGEAVAVCSPVCTPLDGATIEAAIAGLTRALAAVDVPELAAELVAERRALREELKELRRGDIGAGVVRLDDERTRRG